MRKSDKFIFDGIDDDAFSADFDVQLFHKHLFRKRMIGYCILSINLEDITKTKTLLSVTKRLTLRNAQNDACTASLVIDIKMNENKFQITSIRASNVVFGESLNDNKMILYGLFVYFLFIMFNSFIMYNTEEKWSMLESIWFTIITVVCIPLQFYTFCYLSPPSSDNCRFWG